MDGIMERFDISAESDYKANQGARARKTRTVTFRVDSRIVEGLQREADINGISLNILINQLLKKRYYDWGKYESKLNMMPVPKVMLSSCMDIWVDIVREIDTKDTEEYRNKLVRLCSNGRHTEKYVWDMAGQIDNPYHSTFLFSKER
jgi:hypothetical protein